MMVERTGNVTAYVRLGRSRGYGWGRGAWLLVPVGLLVVGLLAVLWSAPRGTLPIPGARRVASFVNQIPFPWKPPKPTHVLPPDVGTQPLAFTLQLPGAAHAQAAGVEGETASPGAGHAASHPAASEPLPPSHMLEGMRHQWQTWNNCGPATIAMATSFFGRPETQAQAAQFLKPNPDDKNVTPDELAAYVRSLGLRADNLYAGNLEQLKRLVFNGVPVVISMWYEPAPNDGMGHYRLLTGYDDAAQHFIFQDSYQTPGVNVRIGYGAFDEDWRVYSRAYLPVYAPEQAEVVAAIVGEDVDEGRLKERALQVALEEVLARQDDAYAWFNAGMALNRVGRTGEAAQAFDRARILRLPWRLLWYQFGPFEAYLAENRLGDVLALTEANLQQSPDLEESQYFKGKALEGQGQVAQARTAFQAALRVNPKFAPAAHALGAMSG